MAEFKESPSPYVDELYGWMRNAFGARRPMGNATRNERTNMVGVAHRLKPADIKEAALWYAKQCPTPGRGGGTALIQQGQELFTKGVPAQHILACMSCHGQEAQGQASAPRLAGQNTEYIQGQMDKFRKGDRKHAPVMTMEARELTAEQVRAAAAYLHAK
jgi:cytochrome c553